MPQMRFSLRKLLLGVALVCTAVHVGRRGWSAYRLSRELRAEELSVQSMVARGRPIAEPVRDGRVVLVKKGKAVGAWVTEMHGYAWMRYRWYYRTDGKGLFDIDDGNVRTGTGLDIRTYQGDDRHIQFGPFKVKYSGATTRWGWIYYDPSGEKTPYRLCFTDRTRIRGLDGLDAQWRYKLTRADPGWSAADRP